MKKKDGKTVNLGVSSLSNAYRLLCTIEKKAIEVFFNPSVL